MSCHCYNGYMSDITNEIWLENLQELGKVPCKTRGCIHKGMVDPKYTENQLGSRCENCLAYINK